MTKVYHVKFAERAIYNEVRLKYWMSQGQAGRAYLHSQLPLDLGRPALLEGAGSRYVAFDCKMKSWLHDLYIVLNIIVIIMKSRAASLGFSDVLTERYNANISRDVDPCRGAAAIKSLPADVNAQVEVPNSEDEDEQCLVNNSRPHHAGEQVYLTIVPVVLFWPV